MLPEVGGLEWLIIAVVALIVVGPKDLPRMLHRLGQFVAKLRGMANEFRASFDEMARQSELDDLRKEVEAMRRGQFADLATQTEHVETAANTIISDIEHEMASVGVNLQTPSYQYDTTTPPPEVAETPVKRPRKPRTTKVKIPEEPAPKATPTRRPPSKTAKKTPLVEGGPRRKTPLIEGGR